MKFVLLLAVMVLGKSTFINSLLGLLPVKQGTISINGVQVTKKNQ